MITVGLTGGIGSGKSTIGKVFEVLKVPIFNADTEAKQCYLIPDIKETVIKLLGPKSYLKGTLDTSFIASQVFEDKAKLEKLNQIIHPQVDLKFEQFKFKHAGAKIIIKEAAILFETGSYKKLDKNILVIAPIELRIKRVMERDNCTEEIIKKRIESQWDDERKKELTDLIIYNDENQLVIPQILNIFNKINFS